MWEVIKDWVFNVIQFFYNGVGDWGMAIIIITIIFRIIVAPLVHKSTTANFAMQKVQPLLQEIQTKFADDPVRQREEMQRLYARLPAASRCSFRCLSSLHCIRCSIAWSIVCPKA